MSGIIIGKGQDGSHEGMLTEELLNVLPAFLFCTDKPYFIVRIQYSWRANKPIASKCGTTSWQSLIVYFEEVSRSAGFEWPQATEEVQLLIELSGDERLPVDGEAFGSALAFRFFVDGLFRTGNQSGTAIGLIVPDVNGYIIRSDIIPLRLVDCPLVERAVSWSSPHQYFAGESIDMENLWLPSMVAASAGGLLFQHDSFTAKNTLDSLTSSLHGELRNRLSFPWLSSKVPERKTLVIVEGGRSGPDNGGTGETIYTAARALGIDMVVFDNPGHWINDSRYATWCKEFFPFELVLQPDDNFSNRLVEAVRSLSYPIHGIITFFDHYKEAVAKAALELSLPTCPPEAYNIATDKFKTSIFEGHNAYRTASIKEARNTINEHCLEFPLIIKPCNGFLSEGVFRVEDLAQLEAGVKAINTDRHGKDFVIEKYCDGPELDANFVLCDGELLFFEASDDFPKSADANGQGDVKSFIELANVLPSKLPETELTLLRDSLHQSLLRMGFQDGFYHLEARLENSAMEYATKDGVFDLIERSVPARRPPYAWLIEVNPRPPGIQESSAVKYTYGIDYFALSLLFALDEKDRVRQLSYAFDQGPQYWCEMVFIPVEQGGVYDSGDVCAELFERRPDLVNHVSEYFCFLKKGTDVSVTGGVNAWVAYFIIFSRDCREHVLELAETVRREVRVSIV